MPGVPPVPAPADRGDRGPPDDAVRREAVRALKADDGRVGERPELAGRGDVIAAVGQRDLERADVPADHACPEGPAPQVVDGGGLCAGG
jgi:hypothetical protein